ALRERGPGGLAARPLRHRPDLALVRGRTTDGGGAHRSGDGSGESKVVFVKSGDGEFRIHTVTLGHTAGGLVAVLPGLDAGEEVVPEGIHPLKSAALKVSSPSPEADEE